MKQKAKYARRLLSELVALDHQTTNAYYEMGRILSAIDHGQLYDTLGYGSMSELVEGELSFTTGTAARYLSTYRHFRRLHYGKQEALALMNEHGYTYISEYLPSAKQKVGKRAIKNRIAEIKAKNQQINFTLTPSEHQETLRTLTALGGSVGDSGRLNHSSEAFMKLIRSYNDRQRPSAEVVRLAG